MADLKQTPVSASPSAAPEAAPKGAPGGDATYGAPGQPDTRTLIEAIEWLFFAYRDFTGDPDAILHEYGFGRAHHRVIHFVGRHPGITVAELLGILKITKQSLARVLKELVAQGYVIQKTGTRDRRQRLLYLSDQGAALEGRLTGPQRERVAKAMAAAGPDAQKTWCAMLSHLVNEEDRHAVQQLISEGHVS